MASCHERAADGGWRFAERMIAIELVGDLSDHLCR